MTQTWHTNTLAVAAGRPLRADGNPVNVPISVSSTYHHFSERDYVRDGSDIVTAFEAALGALDNGKAVAFSSGMAAIAAVAEGLPAGARVVMPITLYSGAAELWTEQQKLGKAEVIEVDTTDTHAVTMALGSRTDLLWLESLSNPLLGVADLPALIALGHQVGATVVVDSTFTTPVLQRPLQLGADIVMHSVTKYIGGHSDLLMGALVAADDTVAEKLRRRRSITGGLPGALDAFLGLRGIRTLPVRMQQQQSNAAVIAQHLEDHHAVEKVLYPGLPSFPGHTRAAAQQEGFGAMMSFTVRGGEAAAKALCVSLRLITHATSLGGVESLLERRAQYPSDASRGSPANLLRMSVGLEHIEDIWADLAQALEASQEHAASGSDA